MSEYLVDTVLRSITYSRDTTRSDRTTPWREFLGKAITQEDFYELVVSKTPPKRMVILGESGVGKTVFMKRTCSSLARRALEELETGKPSFLPVYVPLGQLPKDISAENLKRRIAEVQEEQIHFDETFLDGYRLCLLMDGINENIFNADRIMQAFESSFPHATWIISGQPQIMGLTQLGSRRENIDWLFYRIPRISSDSLDMIIQKRLDKYTKNGKENFEEKSKEGKRFIQFLPSPIREFPVYVDLIVYLMSSGQEIPKSEFMLIDRCMDLSLLDGIVTDPEVSEEIKEGNDKKGKVIGDSTNQIIDYLKKILSCIAIHNIFSETPLSWRNDRYPCNLVCKDCSRSHPEESRNCNYVIKWLKFCRTKNILEDPDVRGDTSTGFIELYLKKLAKKGPWNSEKLCSFTHNTILEWAAARLIDFCVSMARDADARLLLKILIQLAEHYDLLKQCLFLVVSKRNSKLQAEIVGMEHDVSDTILEMKFRIYCSAKVDDPGNEVLSELQTSIFPEDLPRFRKTIRSLGPIALEAPDICRRVFSDVKSNSWDFSDYPVGILSRMAEMNKDARIFFVDSVKNGVHVSRNSAVLSPLVAEDEEIRLLMKDLLLNGDSAVRCNAVAALSTLVVVDDDVQRLLESIVRDTDSDTDSSVLISAINALRPVAATDDAIGRCLAMRLRNVKEPITNLKMVKALMPLFTVSKEIRNELTHILKNEHENINLRKTIMESLCPLVAEHEEIREILIGTLKDSSFVIRKSAVNVLGTLASTNAAIRDSLLRMLDEEDDDLVRGMTVEVLGALASTDAAVHDRLVKMLDKDDSLHSPVLRSLCPLTSLTDEHGRQASEEALQNDSLKTKFDPDLVSACCAKSQSIPPPDDDGAEFKELFLALKKRKFRIQDVIVHVLSDLVHIGVSCRSQKQEDWLRSLLLEVDGEVP